MLPLSFSGRATKKRGFFLWLPLQHTWIEASLDEALLNLFGGLGIGNLQLPDLKPRRKRSC